MFQTALKLLGAMRLAAVAKHVTVEIEEMVRAPAAGRGRCAGSPLSALRLGYLGSSWLPT